MRRAWGSGYFSAALVALCLSPGCFSPVDSPLAADAFEPNDTQADASAVTLPFDQVGLTIDTGSDVDFYSFTLDADATVHVLVTFVDADGDIDITLRDATGFPVGSSSGTTDMEELNTSLTAGTYALEVRTFGSSTNTYDLLIE